MLADEEEYFGYILEQVASPDTHPTDAARHRAYGGRGKRPDGTDNLWFMPPMYLKPPPHTNIVVPLCSDSLTIEGNAPQAAINGNHDSGDFIPYLPTRQSKWADSPKR